MHENQMDFNSLIPIKEKDKKQVVDARDVYAFLEVKKDFSNWMKSNIKRGGFIEGTEFTTFRAKTESTGRKPIDFALTLDTAKSICLMSNTEKGRQARRYFIDIEKKYKEVLNHQMPAGEETSKLINTLLANFAQFSPTAMQTMGVQIAEKYLGLKLPHTALPLLEDKRYSATEIAEELGVSAIRVGKVASELGLKNPPYAEQRLSIAKYTNKEISMFYYNEKAKERIKKYIDIA
jgi:phage anti-repressor protein